MNALAWLCLGALIGAAAVLNAQDAARRMRALNAMRHATQAPAPASPPVPAPPPARAVAPQPPGPGHGGLRKRIDVLICGRTIINDYTTGRRQIIAGNCLACAPATDLDAELRELTDGQH